jgi:hypothetical protein
MPDEKKYDLDYRPTSYWELNDPVATTLNRIQGEARRRVVEAALDAGKTVPKDVLESRLSSESLDAISAIHPSLMGGEFLPKLRPGEVEIARVVLASVTVDVTSLRARCDGGWIRFRVVDEYPEPGIWFRLPIWRRRRLLTMRELITILERTKEVADGKNCNVGLVGGWRDFSWEEKPTLETARGYARFATVKSPFYPQLRQWYEEEADEWLDEKLRELGLEEPAPAL